ncbi:MAG: DUF427 domain-containing protein [Solirubrobacterales bacterium]|nr:DUF427 domain-containing protein [Solirubrobacterales bacterium]
MPDTPDATAPERPRESVWDYPRPPRIEPCDRRVRVLLGGQVIAESERALRVLETSSPPTIYIPMEDVDGDALVEHGGGHSVCEWKGRAEYFNLEAGGDRAERAAWHYPGPSEGFEALAGHVSFYPGRVQACYLDQEPVRPQAGGFYGGWITAEIEGPFKGEPGTEGW